MDTRTSNGGHQAPFAAGETIALQVRGRGAAPISGSVAIMGNATVVSGPSGGGYISIFPTGFPRPTVSNLNFIPNTIVANAFLVPLGPTGAISIYCPAPGVHLIIDVHGWVAEALSTPTGPLIPFDTATLGASDSVKAAQILTNANRYAMTTWWNGPAQTLLNTDLPAGTHDAMRRLGMEALSLSTSLMTGLYDEVAVGVSSSSALQRTVQLIDAVASWHMVNRVNGWGEGWQTPMWAGTLGRAAWFMWDELPASTQQLVAAMVEHEADFSARQKIHYLRTSAGAILTAGDSGSEEVSWNATALQVAVALLPDHPHAGIWLTEMVRFAVAAWARPNDVVSSAMVNGQPLSSWLTGSNVEANGVVINHSRIASDYSTTIYQNLDAAALFALNDQAIPQAARQLVGPVYSAFTAVLFSGASYAASGGVTYVPGTGDIYFPQGNDWGTGQRLPYALADAQALVFGYDPGSAAPYLDLHMDAQLAMQARFSDGKTFANDAEYNYEGREEHTAQLASQLYLTLYLRDHDLVSFTNDPV